MNLEHLDANTKGKHQQVRQKRKQLAEIKEQLKGVSV